MEKYTAKFTSNGYSISSLKQQAKKVAKRAELSHRQALDAIAQQHGFSGWDELARQEANPSRDQFFATHYDLAEQDQEFQGSYAAYIRNKGLPDQRDSLRKYILHSWKRFQNLRLDDLELTEPLAPAPYIEEMARLVTKGDIRAILPKNLPSRLLESTVCFFRLFANEMLEQYGEGYWDKYWAALIQNVSLIKAYQERAREVQIEVDTLFNYIETYMLACEMEFTSRRSKISINTPDIDDFFDGSLTLRLPSEFFAEDENE